METGDVTVSVSGCGPHTLSGWDGDLRFRQGYCIREISKHACRQMPGLQLLEPDWHIWTWFVFRHGGSRLENANTCLNCHSPFHRGINAFFVPQDILFASLCVRGAQHFDIEIAPNFVKTTEIVALRTTNTNKPRAVKTEISKNNTKRRDKRVEQQQHTPKSKEKRKGERNKRKRNGETVAKQQHEASLSYTSIFHVLPFTSSCYHSHASCQGRCVENAPSASHAVLMGSRDYQIYPPGSIAQCMMPAFLRLHRDELQQNEESLVQARCLANLAGFSGDFALWAHRQLKNRRWTRFHHHYFRIYSHYQVSLLVTRTTVPHP